MPIFNVGIRFQPVGEDEKSSEHRTAFRHWALVFTPIEKPEWSLRVELNVGQNNVISFPSKIVDGELFAHPLGRWTGYLDDITDRIQTHPMRKTKYSAVYNNCQHWAATFLLLLRAFASSTPGRQLRITHQKRCDTVLAVLIRENGSKLYHKPNWLLKTAHMAGVGGGAAAAGAAAIAAEATTTVLVPASGMVGWFGVTTAVAVPTVGATIAAVAFPITALAAGGIATTYVVQNARWKKKTTFDDPRKCGSPINTEPLSSVEKGEFLTLVGGSMGDFLASSAPSAACLLGMYSGVHVGVISAACAPGSAAIAAPVAVAVVAGGISVGIKKAS